MNYEYMISKISEVMKSSPIEFFALPNNYYGLSEDSLPQKSEYCDGHPTLSVDLAKKLPMDKNKGI